MYGVTQHASRQDIQTRLCFKDDEDDIRAGHTGSRAWRRERGRVCTFVTLTT